MKPFYSFIIFILFTFSCSQNNEQHTKAKKKAYSIAPPLTTILSNLPDSSKPKQTLLQNSPTPFAITVPTTTNSFYIIKTKKGDEKISLLPPSQKLFDSLQAQGIAFFTNYTTDNGLALDAINTEYKDKTGNLWFGTTGGGVSRYDGKSFVNFTTAQGLANNNVQSITEDKTGNLWFGTRGGGVSCYDGKSFANFTTAQGLANNNVWSITEDKMGNLWFGTNGGGVSCYDGKSFVNFTTEQGLANNNVQSITEDRTGKLWFGTDGGGVSRYDGKSFVNFTTAQGLADNTVWSITEDKTGNLWFGTDVGGVSRYDGKSFVNFTTAQGLANNDIRSIIKDKTGNLWFGTNGGGVSRFDGKSFVNFTTAQGLANNTVRSITEDKTGNLWFGTDGGGVSCYDWSFVNFTTAQGLANNIVWSITEDKTGNLWFGTDGGGVSRYDGKSFVNFTTGQGLANNTVLSITEDKTGNLWFGTDGGGVSRYDGKFFVNFTTAQGLTNNTVWSITEDKTGNLWFGTDGGGVSRYDGKSFVNFTTAQGLANNTVRSITEDKTGNLWFGTDGGGVSRYDGKSFVNFTTAQGLANNTVWSIIEDKTGNLWFGTYGGGVSRYDGKSFVNYTTTQGLPNDFVTQVVMDAEQNIVIATNFGVGVVVSFVPKLLTKNTIPAVNSLKNDELKNYNLKIEIYNSGKGYPVKDVNSGQNAMYKDSKGIIWIGTGADKTGLVRFDYKALNKNNVPPNVFIQSVKINNENIVWHNINSKFKIESSKLDSTVTPANVTEEITTLGKVLSEADRDSMRNKFRDIKFDGITKWYPLPENLILPYKHNSITFYYAAIEPARHYLLKYQYILDGYDNDWSPVTNKTEATFGNIYEGTYTFKLKAQSPFGIWSEPITYTFKVLPPWWRTWWMYTLYVVIAIGVIILVVWHNGRRLRAKAIELKEEVRRATTEISEQKKVVEEKHKEITDSINYAERIQRSLLASKELLKDNLKEYFVFFQPKDVVSGDFYWASKLSNTQFALITADSTGHGVPGAIMSILNISCLEKAIEAKNLSQPKDILNYTRTKIIETLKKDGSEQGGKDGMDCSLISFDFKNNTLTYSAANNPVWIVREKQILEFAPDKMPVGKHDRDAVPFTQHTIDLQKNDMIYTITDGMPDQFGGPKGKKFMYKQLKELLISLAPLPMQEQKENLTNALNSWKGNLEQVDDVCLIGVRV